MMQSILITGASGFIGENLAHRFSEESMPVLAFGTRRPRARAEKAFSVDLSVRDDFSRALEGVRVDTVIHTAALTSPDLCEREPRMAHAVNVEGTREVARWAEERGARMIYLSTDLIFDGNKGWYNEDDPPGPINVYGRTKLDGEDEVRRICTRWVVLRLALSYGETRGAGGDWTLSMRRALTAGRTLHLYTDQFRTPAYVGDTAEAVFRLARAGRGGLYHLGGSERISRYDFGRKLCRLYGLDERRFVPVRMAEVRMDAPRAGDCSLDAKRLARELGLVPCDVEQGLRRQRREEETLAEADRSPARDSGA
jgi:dTDP-4-dehydrorhamnose reductase